MIQKKYYYFKKINITIEGNFLNIEYKLILQKVKMIKI